MNHAITIAPSIRAAFGEDICRRLASGLQPIDCQARDCGEEFGENDEVTLAVDLCGGIAHAALYHSDCRASEWRTLRAGDPYPVFNVSWRADVIEWPTIRGPLFLANPTCEVAFLQRKGQWRRRWHDISLTPFTQAGFASLRSPSTAPHPNPALRTEFKNGLLHVYAKKPTALNDSHWNSKITEEIFSEAVNSGRIAVGLTTAVNPREDDVSAADVDKLNIRGDLLLSAAQVSNGASTESQGTGSDRLGLSRMLDEVGRAAGSTEGSAPSVEVLTAVIGLTADSDSDHRKFGRDHGRISGKQIRGLQGRDKITAAFMFAGTSVKGHWTHVILPDQHTATEYEKEFRALLSSHLKIERASVTRKAEKFKITIGTYEEFRSVGRRLEQIMSEAAGSIRIVGLAIDPPADFAPDGFMRYYSQLAEA